MSQSSDVVPELKQILGAMVFAASRPLEVKKMRECIVEVAKAHGGELAPFVKVRTPDIVSALGSLGEDIEKARIGFTLVEVAGGYRLQSDASCGRWLRFLLDAGGPSRLSRPALETLSIIAYRQPIAKSDIEVIRGVNADHVVKSLMEMHLVKIEGRSELPGRPFLYGTTQAFLEHFGLKDLSELRGMEPMLIFRQDAGKDGAEKVMEEAELPMNAPATDMSVDDPEDDHDDEFEDDDDG